MTILRAAVVSRALRRAGFRPLPSGTPWTREGIRVRQAGTHVWVSPSFDSNAKSLRVADDLVAALQELGFVVSRSRSGFGVRVERRAS